MLIFLTAIGNILSPYWDTYRKRLSKEGFASLTIIHSPNMVGHLVGIAVLLSLGLFVIPSDPQFFLCWAALIVVVAMQLTLNIWGLVRSNFFGVQLINNLGFVASSIAAVFFLHEHLQPMQYVALGIAVIGVSLFAWPKSKIALSKVDTGIIFVIISVILGGFSSVIYKAATFHVPNYTTFLTGRFMVDLIVWTILWCISLAWMHRGPFKELSGIIREKAGKIMIVGVALSSLLTSWLVYELPVTKLAIIGTIGIPASYLISNFKYREKLTKRMWLGTICILLSIGIFLIY